jgi:hypothetical protein
MKGKNKKRVSLSVSRETKAMLATIEKGLWPQVS